MTLQEYKNVLAFVLNKEVNSKDIVDTMLELDKKGGIDRKVLAQMVAVNTKYILANAEKTQEKEKTEG